MNNNNSSENPEIEPDRIREQIAADADLAFKLLVRARHLSTRIHDGFEIIAAAQAKWESTYSSDLLDDDVREGENFSVGYRLRQLGIEGGALKSGEGGIVGPPLGDIFEYEPRY